ncbi:MAG: phytanoyl-CoA dioxygenase family protein [Lautropia sp.]
MLTREQIDAYRRDGFLVIQSVFDEQTVQRMRDAVDRLIAGARGVRTHDALYDLDPAHTPEQPRVRRIKQPHLADPAFDAVMRSAALLDRLTPLLPSGVRIKSSKLNMKEGGGGAPVEWHQDWAFYPHTNDDVLAVGVMLDDCRMENGPLLLLPGSHRGPIHDHHADGCFCGAIDPATSAVDFERAVPSIGPAGSISIHHVRLVHGSAQNLSPYPRRLLLFEFTAADAWPLEGVASLEEFDSRLLVGKPSIEPRMTSVPVRMPLPPAPHRGSIYENQRVAKRRYFDAGVAAA